MNPSPAEIRQQLAQCLQQARWQVDILAEDLLPGMLDQPAIIESLQQIATRGQHSRIRLLNRNTEIIARNGHRLIPLIQRLPSIIQARLSAPDRCVQPLWLILTDQQRLLLQKDENAPLHMAGEREATLWQERFNECWEHAQPDPWLRRISL